MTGLILYTGPQKCKITPFETRSGLKLHFPFAPVQCHFLATFDSADNARPRATDVNSLPP
jgi:hypothetical protein